MTLTHDELVLLLEDVQNGNLVAEQDLILGIASTHMNRRIGRYLYRNRTVENEDLKQEFMIGVGLAIRKCRLDIGDPIEYIVAQGVYRVRTYLRSQMISKTVQVCNECGKVTRLNRIGDNYVCKRCGSTSVITQELNDNDETKFQSMASEYMPIEDEVISEMMMERFEATLQDGTNLKNLYVLLKAGVNRDNPAIKNYIKEIAKIWGGCSEQNVVQSLMRLQDRLNRFAKENGLRIQGNKFIEES